MLTVESLEMRIANIGQSSHLAGKIFAEVTYGNTRFPLWVFEWGKSELPSIIIQAGVHGDEPGGIEAALRLLETLAEGVIPLSHYRLVVIPCANPSGFAGRTRSNGAGQDINRQFHADLTQESAAIRRLLDLQSAAAIVELHTDSHTPGYYLFELRQEGQSSLGQAILGTLTKRGYPVEAEPFFGGYRGEDGLFAPNSEELTEFQRRVPGRSLSEWGMAQGVPWAFPLEAPYLETFERSAAMHITALFALFGAMEEQVS
jgi:protein MpaA